MEQRERYLEFDRKEKELRDKVKDLEARLPDLEHEAAEADTAAYKAELLEEGGWKGLRADADRKKGLPAAAREDIRRAKDGVLILSGEKKKLVQGIRAELMATYRPQYAKLMKDLSEKIAAAAEVVGKTVELRATAQRESRQFIDGGWGEPLCGNGRSNIEAALAPEQVEEFKKYVKLNGYEI